MLSISICDEYDISFENVKVKTKVFPTIAPKIQAVFGNTLQPGLHLQDLRNFPMKNVLKKGGVPLSSSKFCL